MSKVTTMQASITINDALESISVLSDDDQMMIAEIVRKRVVEKKRQELFEPVKLSREEYRNGTTEHGSVEDFLKSLDDE